MIRTHDISVGDRIDLPGRGVIVTDIAPDGVSVIWFDDMGRGPYSAVLPHAGLNRHMYHDERNVDRSWWETHPDVTGKTGAI